jgi:hypothetical protein
MPFDFSGEDFTHMQEHLQDVIINQTPRIDRSIPLLPESQELLIRANPQTLV